ncbi:MAG: DUF3795 domain-containing protein [Bacteroidota bacterium]
METNKLISACGLVCTECEFFLNQQCHGCYAVKGATFWAKEMMPTQVCPLFDCSVNSRGYRSCGNCEELPCATFLQMKDPSISDEEHTKQLAVRQQRLKNNVS